MGGFLFDDIIFGPVKSRRLGVSLGVNLLPTDYKFCSFNCIYCECGWTDESHKKVVLPSRNDIQERLESVLTLRKENQLPIDSITFAGNGEPTLHPDFAEIIEDTIQLRNLYFPEAIITVLSNASIIHNSKIIGALLKVDKNILKLDAGTEATFQAINQPKGNLKLHQVVDYLKKFEGKLIIQTLFVQGFNQHKGINNTNEEEVNAWLKLVQEIQPESVILYPIERETPENTIHKIDIQMLNSIAEKVQEIGFKTEVFY
ncbi:MAG: radical SAM protein [Bacteroidales bacterium]|jgi:wyosine [tRNA(Phe)-imidazoG37] synthetase (radical SAM superfamily)|nr:radical SAM protein [Bacteroidales bacterium]